MIANSAIVEPGAVIGDGTVVWHFSHIRETAVIGLDCNIGEHVYIDNGVVIGRGCKIQNGANLYGPLVIGDNVFIGPGAIVCNDRRPRAWVWDRSAASTTTIRSRASIGAGAIIMTGVTIGDSAMVGAGTVVTKDVPPNTTVVGYPARKLE